MATLACLGGGFYRFIPTTIAFTPAHRAIYFPSLPEVLMSIGYIALGIVAFGLAVKYFAVLPGAIEDWNQMSRLVHWRRPEGTRRRDPNQNRNKEEQDGPNLYRSDNSYRRPLAYRC
jgi:hypothetical protein